MTQDELLHLIDQAVAEGWNTLDLSGQGLTELPPEIGQLTQLKTLILGKRKDGQNDFEFVGNQIEMLPVEIGQLAQLKILLIEGNRIKALPKEIGQLSQLRILMLGENQLSSLPREIRQLKNLELIILDRNRFSSIPAEIAQLKQLKTLDFWENSLKEIPNEIAQLYRLRFLDLGGNQLSTLPESIAQLTNLKTLYLSNNQLSTLPESIAQLTNLKTLDLSNNQLSTLPESIAQLTNLKTLYLSNNQLSTLPESIAQFTNLKTLYLRSNQLSTLPESIAQLTNLKTLDLSNNQLSTLPESIAQLTNLQSLYLLNNQLSTLPESIAQLTNLKTLYLSNNQLSTLPESIAQLTNLKTLDLSNNQLSTLPESITQLTNLKTLDLSNNQLSTLPESIAQLTNLQSLYLFNNHLSTLPESIAQLTNLKTLYLRSNHLSTLPESIAQLTNLQSLDLRSNQLSTLPESIAQLTNLQSFDLSNNQLSTLPESIAQLTNLQSLDLFNNQLSTLPESIAQLTNLQSLDLFNNQLSTLPESITQLPKLEKLDLRGNPIPVPPEILGPKESYQDPGDLQAILTYYFQTLDPNGTEPLYEAKFIIVGEGGAGKTTLAKKLLDPDYTLDSDEKSTEGIDVLRWEFDHPNGIKFRANIWDFGGQEIYHATHQFFLTKRSLYALVIDTRQDNTDLYYWLNVVELLSDSSPVFIIKNEKQDRQCDVNERQLKGEFADSLEKVLATNLADNRGLDNLKKVIQQRIVQLPHVGYPLPKVWVRVRAALENYAATRNTITVEDYCDICRTCQLTDKARMTSLSSYLHDLGVILHFHDDPVLKHTVILKPEWGTAAVYKALDTEEVRGNFGRFTRAQLDDIWSDSEYADLRDELLHLMMRFKLCYQIPGTADQYIAPQLLETEKPPYDWNDSQNLLLRYKYEFMPKGILTRFIVEMHKSIEDQILVWKSGVVITNNVARAEVIELYYKGEIQIRVSGIRPKELLTIVSHEIDKINESYERVQVKKLIPCNCGTCEATELPQFYPLDVLNRFIENRQDKIQCQSSFEMVGVRRLIQDVTGLYDHDAKLDRRELGPDDDIFSPAHRKEELPVQTLPDVQQRRWTLVKTLNDLPTPQFEQLLFILEPPEGNVSNASAAQSERVTQLLGWAKSNIGCGLEAVERALAALSSTNN